MRATLQQISELAIKEGDVAFTPQQINSTWIGFEPVTKEQIQIVEKSLGHELPEDYKQFLLITNGFSAVNDSTESDFSPIEKVDFFVNINPEWMRIWYKHGTTEIADQLSRSIMVGGIDQEQVFLLVPPLILKGKWHYWKFASWIPGEEEYDGMDDYFNKLLTFLLS